MDYLSIIKEHGLTVRQIPKETISVSAMVHRKEGDEIVITKLKYSPEYILERRKLGYYLEPDCFIENDETFLRRVKTIKKNNYGGWWMCQQSVGTSTTVSWQLDKCNLAATLEESIDLFLKGAV